jgi:hypothetical protein
MSSLSQLDVVNACISTMGEAPLQAIDADHPFVQSALNALENASTLVQGEGWWFNTDITQLNVDPDLGFVYAPPDAIDVDAGTSAVIKRGARLYDRSASSYDLRPIFGTAPVTVSVVRELAFADLPMLAQQVVSSRAKLDFQSAYDGDDNKYSKIGGEYTIAERLLKAENIRQNRVNLFQSASMQEKLRLVRPMSRWNRARAGW